MTIITCNEINENHLNKVTKQMKTIGAPTVRAIYDGEIYYAIEGSHRLMAAHELGIIPEIAEIEYSDEIITVQVDGEDVEVVISEYADKLMNVTNLAGRQIITF